MKKVLDRKLLINSGRGRPRVRWDQQVEKDLKSLKMRNWTNRL